MNEINQGFEASVFHPDFGNEVVNGRIFINRWKLEFRSDSLREEISMAVLEVELEPESDRVCFHDPNRPGLQIFTSDQSVLRHPSLKQSGKVHAQVTDTLSRREAVRALKLTLYFILACVLVTWFCSVSISFMVRTIAAGVPMEWEEKFGQEEIAKLRKKGLLIDDTNQIAQLTEVAQPLIKALPENRRNLKFYILNNPQPNAFALPGGHVVVHTGLLEMIDTPEELLGVLAHEIAHETQRHVIRHRIAAAGPLVIFGVFMRGRNSAGNVLALGSGLMVYQGFSQEYETEADDVGWKYLIAANIDPRGMIDTFKKIKGMERMESFVPQAFASHPALSKRIARLERKWSQLGQQAGFLELKPVSWPKSKEGVNPWLHFPVSPSATND